MVKIVIFNSSNVVNDGTNSRYVYNFPQGGFSISDSDKIGLCNASIYYSNFSITQYYNNNLFKYYWYDANGITTAYDVLLPDSNMSIQDINSYFQYVMISNNHYLINETGQYVYYLEFIENSQRYAFQFNAYPLPTELPTGWTAPTGFTFPTQKRTPQIDILNYNNFYKLIGFSPNLYPPTSLSTSYSVLSDLTPQISPVNSYVLLLSVLNSPTSIPSTILYSLPITAQFGGLIEYKASEVLYVDTLKGNFTSLTLDILDQNLNRVYLKDNDILITIAIKSKDDY